MQLCEWLILFEGFNECRKIFIHGLSKILHAPLFKGGKKKNERKKIYKLAMVKRLIDLWNSRIANTSQQHWNMQSCFLPGHTHSGRHNEITDTDFGMHRCIKRKKKKETKTKANKTKCTLRSHTSTADVFKWSLFQVSQNFLFVHLVLNSCFALWLYVAKPNGKGQRRETLTACGLSINCTSLPLESFQRSRPEPGTFLLTQKCFF